MLTEPSKLMSSMCQIFNTRYFCFTESSQSFYSNLSIDAAAAKPLQSCPTLCDPIDGSPPGSPVPGILQVRTLRREQKFFLL